MNLATYINFLQKLDPDAQLPRTLLNPTIYKGVYSEIAFSVEGPGTVGHMLGVAQALVGKSMSFNAGGSFIVTGLTKIHVVSKDSKDPFWDLIFDYMLSNVLKGSQS